MGWDVAAICSLRAPKAICVDRRTRGASSARPARLRAAQNCGTRHSLSITSCPNGGARLRARGSHSAKGRSPAPSARFVGPGLRWQHILRGHAGVIAGALRKHPWPGLTALPAQAVRLRSHGGRRTLGETKVRWWPCEIPSCMLPSSVNIQMMVFT
jgi:hypothetical protein